MPALTLQEPSPHTPERAPWRRAASAAPALGIQAGPRRGIVATIAAVHGLALWGLLQLEDVRRVVVERAPILVHLIDAPAGVGPLQPPPPPPELPTLALRPVPTMAPRVGMAPLRSVPTVVAPQPSPEPAEPSALPPPGAAPLPVASITVPLPAALPVPIPAPVPAPLAPPQAPRAIPSSAVQYLDPPTPVYPRLSIRSNETGVVLVRVLIGEDGLPREVQLARSSGFARLDEAALASVQKARFRPPTENGQPISGWARIEIPFELER